MAGETEIAVSEAAEGSQSNLWSKLARFYIGTTVVFWPFTDLAMRFFVALPFLRSGFRKAQDWDTAVKLATFEYPVSFMEPVTAAATGLTIELIVPLFLLFGFLTRPAAALMAALTIMSQIVYVPTTTNLMLIAMLTWYLIYGPAAISMDFYWVRKSKLAQLPVLRHCIAIGKWSHENTPAVFLLAMRLWLALALLALAGVFEPSIALATWLPSTSFFGLPYWVAIVFAALLILGAAASPVSYILTFVVAAFMIAGVHPSVTLYPVLLLGVYDARGAGLLSVDHTVEKLIVKKFPATGENEQIDPDDWLGTLRDWWNGSREFLRKRKSKSAETKV